MRLINLQQRDGSWVNENGRWWEKDPNLVTAYALMALEIIYRRL
jgi:squalene-hopene/tetraprenyl-beta-curcumene cyclase